MRLFVIPEDFRHDQYILKPIFKKMLAHLGRRGKVEVCKHRLLGGVEEALKPENILPIIQDRKGMYQVLVLVVDRDANATRHQRLTNLEQAAQAEFPGVCFIASQAIEECETWLLAGLDLPAGDDWRWSDIRADRDPKEHYLRPLVEDRGLQGAAGEGREPLARDIDYGRMRTLCDELQAIEQRITACLTPPSSTP